MKLSTTLRTALVQAMIDAAGTNAKLKYYNGTESLTPAGTLLATLTITGALGTAASGVINFNETVTQSNGSHVAGTPTFVLVTTSADAAVGTFAIPTDMTWAGTIATGVDITLNTSTITAGNA